MIHYTLYIIHYTYTYTYTYAYTNANFKCTYKRIYTYTNTYTYAYAYTYIYILGTDEIGVVGGSSFLISHLMSKVLFLPFEGARLLSHVVLFVV